jgi:hypothetical protein
VCSSAGIAVGGSDIAGGERRGARDGGAESTDAALMSAARLVA